MALLECCKISGFSRWKYSVETLGHKLVEGAVGILQLLGLWITYRDMYVKVIADCWLNEESVLFCSPKLPSCKFNFRKKQLV